MANVADAFAASSRRKTEKNSMQQSTGAMAMAKIKEDCAMYAAEEMGCVALTKTQCEDCVFYITSEEYEARNGIKYEDEMRRTGMKK